VRECQNQTHRKASKQMENEKGKSVARRKTKKLDLRGTRPKRATKSDEELKQIAKDLWAGKIFSDRNIPFFGNSNILFSVFMPLLFMDKKAIKSLQREKVNFIYEYLDKAGPRAINGMPMFMSCRVLVEPETKKMFEYYNKFKELADTL
jgi:hypothetical protein